jgi:hypothetical protein
MTIFSPSTDVPVVVDAVRTFAYFPMVRCNYLSIECDSPKIGWTIGIGSSELPFLMVGLTGIVTKPFVADIFNTVDSIEDLFRRIEDDAGLLVDIDDLWLPMILFRNINIRPEVGQVYRLNSDMFAIALDFREGHIDAQYFLERCEQSGRSLSLSEEEMAAFGQWREEQIRSAFDQYPKNRNLELEWQENSTDGTVGNSGR